MADLGTVVSRTTLVTTDWVQDVNNLTYRGTAGSVSVFIYMSDAEVADVLAYTYLVDVTDAVQAAMDAVYASGHALYFPPGGYLVTGLEIPGANNNQGKAVRFLMYGAGFGEAAIIGLRNRGSVLYSETDAPILNYTATIAGQGNGEVSIERLAFWGTSSTPIIELDTFFGLSHIENCNIVQSGTGGGVKIGWGATYDIRYCYITGASYSTPTGLGASRTGVGLWCAQDTRSGGLQNAYKTTFAGWHTCLRFGVEGAVDIYTYAPSVDTCEFAYFYIGAHFTDRCESGTLTRCYFEGQDEGVAVLDEGNYNRAMDSLFFFNGGNYTFIQSTEAAKFGSRYTGNVLYMFNGADTIGIDILSNAVDGGPGKVVSNNHFILHPGTAGVVGIKLQGVDPRVSMVGNDFQPAGAWTGAGSAKIANTSTASDTTVGTANYGLAFARSLDQALEVPTLSRGAINLAVEPDALTNASISAGVLTLGELSVFTLTPSGNVSVTSIAAPNLPDKTFSIHVTATAFAVTFTHGALLKLAGSANLVTGANGCWIEFQVKPGGVVWEKSRTVY